MANSQPPHEPTGPTQQQDDIFRVFAIVLGGTIATLASFWTFAQVILFIDPFSLLWVPGVAYCLLFIIAGVLTLYLWGQFFCQTTDGNRFMWLPWFIHRHPGAVLLSCAVLMFLMSSVALKVTSAASELPGFTFAVLGVTFAVLGVVTAVVLVLYLYDRFFCRTTHGNRHTPFPSFMLRHPGAVLLSFAVLMFLMSSVALKTTSEEEIAQKLLADRGMQLSPEELKNQLSLLNHSALSLFGRAGIVTDNIFEVLGQQSPYVSDREPVVLDMIDKIESMGDHAQRHEAVEKLLRWIKGLGNDGNSHLDHTIPVKSCQDSCEIRRSLLGYALSRGAPTLVAALMKEQASPFRAGYDPKAQPGDFYVFAPFYYVAHNTMAFDENDRSVLFDAFEQAGLRPSHFARQTFKKVLGDRGTETDRKCVIGPDKMIADCEWLDGFMLSYQIKNNNQLESIDFAWQDGRLRLQVYGETAIIEGRAIMKTAEPKANVPVFLQIRRQEDELGPASRCPLQELARENAELFLVRANADESFERYTGIWDGDKLCLKGGYQGEGKKLGLQAVDNADWA